MFGNSRIFTVRRRRNQILKEIRKNTGKAKDRIAKENLAENYGNLQNSIKSVPSWAIVSLKIREQGKSLISLQNPRAKPSKISRESYLVRNRDENRTRNALENFIAIFLEETTRHATNYKSTNEGEREKKTKQTKKQGIERYFEISNRASELRGINECVDEARKQKARSNKHISNQSVSTLVKSVTTNNAVFINKFVEDK